MPVSLVGYVFGPQPFTYTMTLDETGLVAVTLTHNQRSLSSFEDALRGMNYYGLSMRAGCGHQRR